MLSTLRSLWDKHSTGGECRCAFPQLGLTPEISWTSENTQSHRKSEVKTMLPFLNKDPQRLPISSFLLLFLLFSWICAVSWTKSPFVFEYGLHELTFLPTSLFEFCELWRVSCVWFSRPSRAPASVSSAALYKRKNGRGRIGIPACNCSHYKHVEEPTWEYVSNLQVYLEIRILKWSFSKWINIKLLLKHYAD